MYLNVVPADDPVVRLAEPDDFTELKVVVHGELDWAALAGHLDPLAYVVPPHVWIHVVALPGLAGRDNDDEWRQGLQRMLQYATRRGWVSEDQSSVRAHFEWVGNTVDPGGQPD
ncbi:hypothetical protein [Parafrankia sp. FMc2]|uniref:hypothetical protein n=1 Tax=Parafrankia sp. FMc2 TaxID=3233196 RepID=UPI0034D4E2F0